MYLTPNCTYQATCPAGVVFEKKLKFPAHRMGWLHCYFIPNTTDLTANSIHIFSGVLRNFAFSLPTRTCIVLPENLQSSEEGKNHTAVLTEIFILFLRGTNVRIPALSEMQYHYRSGVHLLWSGFCYQVQELPTTQSSGSWHEPRQIDVEIPRTGMICRKSLYILTAQKTLTKYFFQPAKATISLNKRMQCIPE